jgi:hypothetical protein
MVRHIGFKGATRKVRSSSWGRKHHISAKRAGAIVASAARKASAKAKRKNPRLKRVRGA